MTSRIVYGIDEATRQSRLMASCPSGPISMCYMQRPQTHACPERLEELGLQTYIFPDDAKHSAPRRVVALEDWVCMRLCAMTPAVDLPDHALPDQRGL